MGDTTHPPPRPDVTLPADSPAAPGAAPAVPGYEMLGLLGRGGMAVVYKARHLQLDRVVALKMLPADWRSQPDLLARFRTEAAAVARLQHPNIVQIFEVGETPAGPFLALEFVGGGPLSQHLARRPQPPREAAALAEQLARAVQHAHEHGILHRDLKPANVLVQNDLTQSRESAKENQEHPPLSLGDLAALRDIQPKITDFGLAKLLDAPDGPTQPGDVLGTPSYMAPEQAAGDVVRPSAGIDVYALGAILYEMLTGRPPFLGATVAETVAQVIAQEPVPPRQMRPDCPRDLETICLKCLEKAPARRYASAGALADDLARWLEGRPITARPAGPLERLAKWARRRPAAAAAVVAGVVLLLIAVAYGFELRRHNQRLRESEHEQRLARERAQANFQVARRAVKELLAEVGAEDLRSVPHMDPVRRTLLLKALAAMQSLLEQDRANPEARRDVAQVAGDVAEVHEMLGQFGEARRHFEDAVAAFRELARLRPGDDALREGLALAAMRLATFHAENGRPGEAAPLFEEALAETEELLRRRPGEPDSRYLRCRVWLNRGQMFGRQGRGDAARDDFARARDELTELVRSDPPHREFRVLLAAAHNNLGVQYRAAGALEPAAAAYRSARDAYATLTADEPQERSYRLRLGVVARNLGNAQWWRENAAETHAAYRQSLDTLRALVRDYPGIPEYQSSLAWTLDGYGEVLDYEGRAEGLQLVAEALAIREELVRQQPGRADHAAGLGRTYACLATARRRRSDWADAASWEARAVAQYRAAVKLQPGDPRYRDALRAELEHQTQSLINLGRLGAAAGPLGELISRVTR